MDQSKNIRVFIGTYTEKFPHVPKADGEGIYVYDLKSAADQSISLAYSSTIPGVINPTYLEITRNKKYLYAVTESPSLERSLIHAYQISEIDNQAAAGYRLIDSWPIGGIGACHVSIDDQDRFVFVSNYGGGSIAAYEIDQSSGKLTKKNFHQFTEFTSVNPTRQERPHLHSSILDSRSRFIYFADLGNDCIWRMNLSQEKGFDEKSLKKFSTPVGSGPRHTAFHGNGKYLYVGCELSNYLLVFGVDENGDLHECQYEPSLQNKEPSNKSVADLHLSSDSRFLYLSTRFEDYVTVFEIQDDGKVKRVQEIESGGKTPRNFILCEKFNAVLVANQDSSGVTIFRRDAQSGKLTKEKTIQVKTPVCLKILD